MNSATVLFRRRRIWLILALAAAVSISWLLVSRGQVQEVRATNDDNHYGYVDQSNGNWFRAQLNPNGSDAGDFQVAIWGLGVFWSDDPATVTRDSNGVGDEAGRLKSFVFDSPEYHTNLPDMLDQTSVTDCNSGDPISLEDEWISIIKFKRGIDGGAACPLHP